MAELHTLARPYAKAVFELARESGKLQSWSEQLQVIVQAVAMPEVAAMIDHPATSRVELANALTGALGKYLTGEGISLVRLLAENGRLAAVAQIAEQFEALRADAESRADVEIATAIEVAPAQKKALGSAIAKRLAREVEINWAVDETLLAGAIIRVGDLVIDGSVRGELDRLKLALAKA